MKSGRICLALGLACLSFSALAAEEVSADAVKVKSAIIATLRPSPNNAEAWMDLQNTGHKTHTLVAAICPVAQQTQLHATGSKSNKMNQLNGIQVKPGKDQDLRLGGLHLMLIGIKHSLSVRANVDCTLVFEDGSWSNVKAVVAHPIEASQQQGSKS